MALLSFFDRENKLTDKKFSKLTMEEASLCEWMCLEAPQEASKVAHEVLGLDWRKLPFKSLCEVLELRLGDTFFDKNEAFDFDTWNMLFYLGSNLNSDQKDFLRKNNFLPHKYAACKDELKSIQKQVEVLEIAISEYKNSDQTDQIDIAEDKIDALNRRKIYLNLKKKTWEKENPNGGNPADAKEYIDNFVDLKGWMNENTDSAAGRTQMFTIITQQMKTALNQSRDGKSFPQQDLGHYEERLDRQAERKRIEDAKNGKAGWFSFGNKAPVVETQKEKAPKTNKQKYQQDRPKRVEPVPPPTITNTTARSTKAVPVAIEAVVETEEQSFFVPKQKPIVVDKTVVLEPKAKPEPKPKRKPELRPMKQKGDESHMSDYERIQRKVLEKQKESKKPTNSNSKSLIIVTIVVVVTLVAIYLF